MGATDNGTAESIPREYGGAAPKAAALSQREQQGVSRKGTVLTVPKIKVGSGVLTPAADGVFDLQPPVCSPALTAITRQRVSSRIACNSMKTNDGEPKYPSITNGHFR
jgi:hypothetical protein